ncbi:MAG: chemotaxis response regulator protein-glutamate methylesterase [PVC group bacterium]|nr:chemotaxis response regulator protein-glutamate methylesterase [PVC group bacterium]
MIRVLVVDDSAFMRKRISDILNADNDIEVVATAKTGAVAMKKVASLKPDVVTMDIVMPDVDGLTALNYIMHEFPAPVVIISANATPGSRNAMKALKMGAVEVLTKPGGEISLKMDLIEKQIVEKVKAASKIDVNHIQSVLRRLERKPRILSKQRGGVTKLVAIGASTGGPKAIKEILPYFSSDVPAAFLIVQHMPEVFTKAMAERINAEAKIEIKEAEEGDIVQDGWGYVAPGGYHMVVVREGPDAVIHLNQGPPVNNVRPSITVMMNSVAKEFQSQAVGVLLTGMGQDGVEGLRQIKQVGGQTLAEHESTCIVFGMPKIAIKEGVVDKVVPLYHMGIEVMKQITR